jgi:hypothetical protein
MTFDENMQHGIGKNSLKVITFLLEALQLEIYEKTMKSQNCKTHNLGILRLPLGSLQLFEMK